MKAAVILLAFAASLVLCLAPQGAAGEDVQALINKLQDEKERPSATQQLIKLGREAVPELKRSLENQRGDMKVRLETILFEIANFRAKKIAEQGLEQKDIPAFLKKNFAQGKSIEQEQWLSLVHLAWRLHREAKNTVKSGIVFPNFELQNLRPAMPAADSITDSFLFLADKEKPPFSIKNSVVLAFSDLATVTEINNCVVFCDYCKATMLANSFVHATNDLSLTDLWNSTVFVKRDVAATYAKNNYVLVGGKFRSGAVEDSFVFNKREQVELVTEMNNSFTIPKSKSLAFSFLFGE